MSGRLGFSYGNQVKNKYLPSAVTEGSDGNPLGLFILSFKGVIFRQDPPTFSARKILDQITRNDRKYK